MYMGTGTCSGDYGTFLHSMQYFSQALEVEILHIFRLDFRIFQTTVYSRASAPVKANISALDILGFTGGRLLGRLPYVHVP